MSPELIPRVYLSLRCNMHCSYCSNGPEIAEYDELDATAWLKRLEDFPGDEVIFSGGEPTLHKDFAQIMLGCVEAGCHPHVYTNLEKPIPAALDKAVGFIRLRCSCHSQTPEAAREWVARARNIRTRGYRGAVTTVCCPDDVIEELRGAGVVVNTGQRKPPMIKPPVRCIVNRIYLAPDGTRYHCVGKLVKKDASGVVADDAQGTVICLTPNQCALCDSLISTRIPIE